MYLSMVGDYRESVCSRLVAEGGWLGLGILEPGPVPR